MKEIVDKVVSRVGEIVLGKEPVVRLALTCLIARGHLLIEDLPGVGKTMLSLVLAKLLGLSYQRIQFTSDLLPADIIGVSVYERKDGLFRFHPGPIFAQLVLADEINRTTPKTQSALLEAMEERQITTEGETRVLPKPFFVIATQNPAEQIGTFPLPESQLDRFLMRISMGYPDRDAERALFKGQDRREMVEAAQPCLTPRQLHALQRSAANTHVSDALLDYLQALVHFTRSARRYGVGLSPRAGLALLHAARAWALMQGRKQVIPEDLQAVVPAVVSHRLGTVGRSGADDTLATRLLDSVPVP